MKIKHHAVTHPGKVRTENQDSFGILESKKFYVVCDGMGGGAAGDFASRVAVEVMLKAQEVLTSEDIQKTMGNLSGALGENVVRPIAAIRLANRALYNFTERYPKLAGMGTTAVVALFEKKQRLLHVYHVGDSRVYRVRNGHIELMTKDHSKVNELIESGKMKEEEVKTAEIQSMITRALGTNPKVKVDYRVIPVMQGDIYILCTDGLNTVLDDNAIRDSIIESQDDVERIPQNLIDKANSAGGLDNTTVLVLKILDEGDQSPEIDGTLSFNAITIGEETLEQLTAEDLCLKSLLRGIKISVPAAVRDKWFLENPLYLTGTIAVLIFLSAMFFSRENKGKYETKLQDLAGEVSGIAVEVRTPTPEQLQKFWTADDVIQKLQMIQDWRKDKETNTVPLVNGQIIVVEDGKEQIKAISSTAPVEIKMSQGTHTFMVKYQDYRIITDKMEYRDSETVSVEMGKAMKPELILMMPSK